MPSEPLLPKLRRLAVESLVMAAIAALAIWGHHTGWKWTSGSPAPVTEPKLVEYVASGVRLASPEVLDRLAIDIAIVEKNEVIATVTAPAELAYAPHLLGTVSARSSGVAWRVLKCIGDRVSDGEPIAYVESPALAAAQVELLQGLVQYRHAVQDLEALSRATAVTATQRNAAEAALQSAKVRISGSRLALAALGVTIDEAEWTALSAEEAERRAEGLGRPAGVTTDSSALLTVKSPLAGIVTALEVAAGEAVEPNRPLATVVNPSVLTVTMHVAPADASRVKPGQRFRFKSDTLSGEANGVIIAVVPGGDAEKRTLLARGEIDNPQGTWRAHSFGSARIEVQKPRAGLTVPDSAVHALGDRRYVLVRDPADVRLYHARAVRLGVVEPDRVEVIGLAEGDVVLSRNSRRLTGGITEVGP